MEQMMAGTGAGPVPRPRRDWLRMFVMGFVLWVATVVTTFVTRNPNLIPTLVLLGSFLVPVTFVVLELIVLALIVRYVWTWPRTAPPATMATSPDRDMVRVQQRV